MAMINVTAINPVNGQSVPLQSTFDTSTAEFHIFEWTFTPWLGKIVFTLFYKVEGGVPYNDEGLSV